MDRLIQKIKTFDEYMKQSDDKAFVSSVLAKAKKDANHWYKNIQDRLL